ncbi:MAG: class I SAM-dependent methyltransferase [Acidimicrobiales bacterium]
MNEAGDTPGSRGGLPARARGSTEVTIGRQRRFWGKRAAAWDHHAQHNPGLVRVVERVIADADGRPSDRVVDLGCGSGQLALRLAPDVTSVLAVDVSPEMIELLEENARRAEVGNVRGLATPIEHLSLEAGSVDLVVSNYALHHLRDEDKKIVVERAATWLNDGGRLVIGDMMFGIGGTAADRQIISSKIALFAKKGPAGWWRIAKNTARYLLRLQERPISLERWMALFERAGLVAVEGTRLVNEAAVVKGIKKEQPIPG